MNADQLPLTDARIVSLAWYPTAEGGSNVLLMRAPLTQDLAGRLKCDSMVFDLDWNPRQFEGSIGLTKQMSDCEISIPGIALLRPDLVWKIKVSHAKRKPAEDGDETPELEVFIRAKFKGEEDDKTLQALKKKAKRNGRFDMALTSLQGELDYEGDGPDGGKRVDMSGDPTEVTAIDRHRELQEETPELTGEDDSVSLPSARHMAGGTTDAAKKARRNRQAVTA